MNARFPDAARSTTREAPDRVSEKGEAALSSVEKVDALGNATLLHSLCVAAITRDALDISTSTPFEASAASITSLSDAFTVTPSRADRITPVRLTMMASPHSGHNVGSVSTTADVEARDRPDEASLTPHSSVEDALALLNHAPTTTIDESKMGDVLVVSHGKAQATVADATIELDTAAYNPTSPLPQAS